MKIRHNLIYPSAFLAIATLGVFAALEQSAAPPNPELQQRVAEIKQAAAANKQSLAQYSWQQQQTIAIKGETKDTKLFQVHAGANGQQQKMELQNMAASSGDSGGRIKHHIVEKKKEEYLEYGEQIKALAEQYVPPDPERLQHAFQQGNITLGPSSVPGEVRLIITNYLKPNDRVTLIFNRQAKAIQSLDIAAYLTIPRMPLASEGNSALPDGTNHVDTVQANGVSKNLVVTMQNTNYQKVM